MARNPDYWTQQATNYMNSPERSAEMRREKADRNASLAREIQGTFTQKAALEKVIQGTFDEKSSLAKWQKSLEDDTTRRGQDLTVATTQRGQDITAATENSRTAAYEKIGMAPHKYDEALAPFTMRSFGITPDKANEYLNADASGRQSFLKKFYKTTGTEDQPAAAAAPTTPAPAAPSSEDTILGRVGSTLESAVTAPGPLGFGIMEMYKNSGRVVKNYRKLFSQSQNGG